MATIIEQIMGGNEWQKIDGGSFYNSRTGQFAIPEYTPENVFYGGVGDSGTMPEYNTSGYRVFNGLGRKTAASAYEGHPFDFYDMSGKKVRSGKFTGTGQGGFEKAIKALVSVMGGYGVGTAIAGAGAAAGAGASGGGGGMSGAGFGDAGLMYGGADAASAGSLGMGGVAGGGGTAMGAGASGGIMDVIKAGASKVLGGSGGGGGFDWTDLIQPAISIGTGIYGANQTKKAADTMAQAQRDAAAQFQPWIKTGGWAIDRAGTMMGSKGAEAAKNAFMTSPDYQFRLGEQEKALQRIRSSKGLLGSGGYVKDALKYSGDLASGEFGTSFNRLMGLAGMGQTATNSSAGYNAGASEALGAGRIGAANALTNGITQGVSMYNQNQSNNAMNALLQRYLSR